MYSPIHTLNPHRSIRPVHRQSIHTRIFKQPLINIYISPMFYPNSGVTAYFRWFSPPFAPCCCTSIGWRCERRDAVPHGAMAVFEPGNSHQMAVVLEEKTCFKPWQMTFGIKTPCFRRQPLFDVFDMMGFFHGFSKDISGGMTRNDPWLGVCFGWYDWRS